MGSIRKRPVITMPTLCIQCALRAFVEGKPVTVFDETHAEHMTRVHPDPEVTRRERAELERRAQEIYDRIERND
jgi:hypothetical protein